AIAESGANFVSAAIRVNISLQQAEQEGVKISQSLNASSIAELRNKSAEELLQRAQGMHGPIIDGYVLPDEIINIFTAHKENNVSLLTGWNEDEGFLFGPAKTAETFRKEANEKYAADTNTFLQFFPADNDS